jgi:hypothetical protein
LKTKELKRYFSGGVICFGIELEKIVVLTEGVLYARILGRGSGLHVSIRTVDANVGTASDPSADTDCENLTFSFETNCFSSIKQ